MKRQYSTCHPNTLNKGPRACNSGKSEFKPREEAFFPKIPLWSEFLYIVSPQFLAVMNSPNVSTNRHSAWNEEFVHSEWSTAFPRISSGIREYYLIECLMLQPSLSKSLRGCNRIESQRLFHDVIQVL